MSRPNRFAFVGLMIGIGLGCALWAIGAML